VVRVGQRVGESDSHFVDTYAVPTVNFRGPSGEAALKMVDAEARPILDVFRGVTEAAPGGLALPLQAPVGDAATEVAEVAGVAAERSEDTDPDGGDAVTGQVRVLNGSGLRGHAGKVGDALTGLGFDVVGVGDAADTVEITEVSFGEGAESLARALDERILGPTEVTSAPELGEAMVLVTVAADLESIADEPVESVATDDTQRDEGPLGDPAQSSARPSPTPTGAATAGLASPAGSGQDSASNGRVGLNPATTPAPAEACR